MRTVKEQREHSTIEYQTARLAALTEIENINTLLRETTGRIIQLTLDLERLDTWAIFDEIDEIRRRLNPAWIDRKLG